MDLGILQGAFYKHHHIVLLVLKAISLRKHFDPFLFTKLCSNKFVPFTSRRYYMICTDFQTIFKENPQQNRYIEIVMNAS